MRLAKLICSPRYLVSPRSKLDRLDRYVDCICLHHFPYAHASVLRLWARLLLHGSSGATPGKGPVKFAVKDFLRGGGRLL